MKNNPRRTVLPARIFRTTVKRLRKKYRHIESDLSNLIEQLQSGETPGDHLQSTPYILFKVRVPNSDTQRGKSGGYRVIYYLQKADQVILVYIYVKSSQTDVRPEELEQILQDVLKEFND
jgi:mRNA-degrading endonuclease RelE of RelBE toxin-antitoxin system